MGADAVELDVRLTADRVLVVYHYFYLDKITDLTGPIFTRTWDEISRARFSGSGRSEIGIPLLEQVLDVLAGRIGLEIEIKGPETSRSTFLRLSCRTIPRPGKISKLHPTNHCC